MARESVKIFNAAMDELENGAIILRGIIDPGSFDQLCVGPYQREVAPHAKIQDLMAAFKTGSVPDIEMGLRGGHYREDGEGVFFLKEPLYIVDGLQRVSAARVLMATGFQPHLGTTIHFNTTEDWERERFRILNELRMKISSNILIRNTKEDNDAVAILYEMSHFEKDFLLANKVCWNQRMARSHLITSTTLVKITALLHSGFSAGRSSNITAVGKNLETQLKKIGRTNFKANVKTFWNLLDSCWGVRNIAIKEGAAYLRYGFLWALTDVLASYEDFWKGHKLYIDSNLAYKIKLFPLNDPHIRDLCSSGGQASKILSQHLVNHINSGKRTKRLRARPRIAEEFIPEDEPVLEVSTTTHVGLVGANPA